jgi:histidyl-tRNA synthetase
LAEGLTRLVAQVGLPVLETEALYNRAAPGENLSTPTVATPATSTPTAVGAAAAAATATAEYFPKKEMFTVADVERNSVAQTLALRPEGTAGLVRAVTPLLHRYALPQRYYYAGPMFRRERPQHGRFRQFHQFGVELFGPAHPLLDVEVMALGHTLLRDLGVDHLVCYTVVCLWLCSSTPNAAN